MSSNRTLGNWWVILRTSGGRTLALADSLNAVGFEVWTPIETKTHKRRGGKSGTVERKMPMMPTFVFASAARLPDLAAIIELPISPHPAFSIFRYLGRIPLISDASVDALRDGAIRAVPKAKRPTIPVGTKVRATDGPFIGLSGVVEDSRDGYTMVFFGGWMSPKIETLLLSVDDVDDA